MKLIKRAGRPDAALALDQGGVWLVEDDCPGTTATKPQVDAVTIDHPEGGGCRMLRRVPAGLVLVEIEDGKIKAPKAKDREAAAQTSEITRPK